MWVDKEFLGAFVQGHRKNVRWCIDDEFAYKLLKKAKEGCKESLEALRFLTKFNNEYHKNVISKSDPTALHNTPELRKECSDRSNASNRDVASIYVRAENDIQPKDEAYEPESAWIAAIDMEFLIL